MDIRLLINLYVFITDILVFVNCKDMPGTVALEGNLTVRILFVSLKLTDYWY